MDCEILQSPMIPYQSLLYSTTVLYDTKLFFIIIITGQASTHMKLPIYNLYQHSSQFPNAHIYIHHMHTQGLGVKGLD